MRSDEVVLVVEDEDIVRLLVVEVLNDLGYRALEAADGPSALRILQSAQRIDLLITDIGLPDLNGRQVADAARVEASRPQDPVHDRLCGDGREQHVPRRREWRSSASRSRWTTSR